MFISSQSVGPAPHQVLPEIAPSDNENDLPYSLDLFNQEDNIETVTIKSCLRKPKNSIPVSCISDEDHEVSCDEDNDPGWKTELKKVQWIDARGGKLAEILGYEPRKSTPDRLSSLQWCAQYQFSISFPWIAVKYPTKRLPRDRSIKGMVTNRVEASNIAKMMVDPMMIVTMGMM